MNYREARQVDPTADRCDATADLMSRGIITRKTAKEKLADHEKAMRDEKQFRGKHATPHRLKRMKEFRDRHLSPAAQCRKKAKRRSARRSRKRNR